MGLNDFLRKLTPFRYSQKLSPYINIYNYRTGALQQFPLTLGQPAVYPTQDITSYIKAYSNNASVYTIVSNISSKFGYIPRYVYKVEDEDAAEDYKSYIKQKDFNIVRARKMFKKAFSKNNKIRKKNYGEMEVDNPLADLLNSPNPLQGQDEFFELQDIMYELTGECFIWLNRGGMVVNEFGVAVDTDTVLGPARAALPITEMWVLPSQFMAMNIDRSSYIGNILNYIFIRTGAQIPIPKEDIIHWKTPNPNYDPYNYTHLRGLSPLSAGLKLYTADDAAMDAMVAMQQNDGAKGVLYNASMNNLKPEQKSAAEDAINNKINNRNLKSAVAMLPGEWGYLNTGMNSIDMDLLESQDKMFSRLCNLYRVNPNFFLSGQTFDNLQQARKDFITQTIMPRACTNRDELNRQLLQAFGLDKTQFTIDIDVTNLPEMQDDMAKQVTALAAAWWLTPNKRLEQMNEERSDDPNMDEIWIPNNLTLMDDAAMPTPTLGFGGPNSMGKVPGRSTGLPAGTPPQGNNAGNSNGQAESGGAKSRLRLDLEKLRDKK